MVTTRGVRAGTPAGATMRGRNITLGAALVLVTIDGPAHARPPDKEPRWHVVAEGTTDLPLAISGRALLESPGRFRLAGSLGVMPRPYVQLLNQIIIAAGGYDRRFGPVFVDTLTSSLVPRVQLGWRPWADLGWYADLGYSVLTLGSASAAESFVGGLVPLPDELMRQIESRHYRVEATVHLAVVELGYEWLALDALTLRWAVGFAGTFAASASIDPEGREYSTDDPVTAFSNQAEGKLHDLLTSYGFMPTIAFGLGYRFDGPRTVE